MQIAADVVIPFPRARVFATYRDRMTELLPYLPNIVSIEVKSRHERAGDVELVSLWMGGGDIPKLVRGILNASMLGWTDYATWIAGDHSVVWRTEVHAFPGAVSSAGKNHFIENGAQTQLQIRGDLSIDPNKVPGVPRFLGKSVAESAEKFIVGQVQQNLTEVAKGVGLVLAANS